MWHLAMCMYVFYLFVCSVCGGLGRHIFLVSGYFCRLCLLRWKVGV